MRKWLDAPDEFDPGMGNPPRCLESVNGIKSKRDGRAPNVIGIFMGAMEITESEIIKTQMAPIDVLIQPQIGMYTTLEFTKTLEIIKRGEDAAR